MSWHAKSWMMSAVAESRSIAYSADTAGRAGRIACQVIRTRSMADDRVGFSIAIRNETASEARALAFVPDALDLHPRTILQTVIAPHADFSTSLVLATADYGAAPALSVELSGNDIDFTLIVPSAAGDTSAPAAAALPAARVTALAPLTNSARPPAVVTTTGAQPQAPRVVTEYAVAPYRRETVRAPLAIPALATFAALLTAVAGWIVRPQITQFDLPQRAAATRDVTAAYRATGLGDITYSVAAANGRTVASGRLAPGPGVFTFRLPGDTGAAYLVRLGVNGLLGSTLAERYISVERTATAPVATRPPKPRATAAARPAPPQIHSLAVDRATVSGGATLNVYYDVDGSDGTVALTDAASLIKYGTAALSPSGHTAFTVPDAQAPRFLSVVVNVRRGGATTQSRTAVTVVPSSPAPLAEPIDGQAAPAGAQAAPADDGLGRPPEIQTEPSARAGEAVRIGLSGSVDGLVLTLSDESGREIAHAAVSAGQRAVIFRAPAVSVATRFRVEATYPQGEGAGTVVKTIVVRP